MKTYYTNSNSNEWNEFKGIDSKFKKTITILQDLFDKTQDTFSRGKNSAEWYRKSKNKFKIILNLYDPNSPYLLKEVLNIYKNVFVRSKYYKKINKVAKFDIKNSKIA